MEKFKNRISFVVATKDRPLELCRLLRSLSLQSYPPDEIIVVDSSQKMVHGICEEFPNLPLRYVHRLPPSATRQRNYGIQVAHPAHSLVGILDDDVLLEPDACEVMMKFWENASSETGGAAFNLVNHPQLYASWVKHLPLVENLGLYSRETGQVLSSGFQVMMGYLRETKVVQWLPVGASVWRREIFKEFQFDEWYDGYSYLEDLDFSYRVGKKYRLLVIAGSKFYHHPPPQGRGSGYVFGKREVVNRLYFVKKHPELSLSKCYLALVIRIFISLLLTFQEHKANYLGRVCGNLAGLLESVS